MVNMPRKLGIVIWEELGGCSFSSSPAGWLLLLIGMVQASVGELESMAGEWG